MELRVLLEQSGIRDIDDTAIAKLQELSPDDQTAVLGMYEEANSVNPILSASKWLFAKARTVLATRAKAAGKGHAQQTQVPPPPWSARQVPQQTPLNNPSTSA